MEAKQCLMALQTTYSTENLLCRTKKQSTKSRNMAAFFIGWIQYGATANVYKPEGHGIALDFVLDVC